ncbi:hypothetical protein G7062_09480 [Erysipelothrix sp. HDW6C]|uniref:VOC family protein n=1 Tax=Erysipelothrix sp. HDW6C TaxID=2714930 RepID=UPI00140ABDAF|nr:VOC family protein [Erysipelothrix sp. HDW6C]QIK70520.1 hypothetical protein G7062_09480 [Erysipelothrix sp. HDW6C]
MLHHIELYVADLNETRQFWSWFLDTLGYALYQEWPDGFSYRIQDTYIVFVQTEDKYLHPPYHRKHSGLNHLAFHVANQTQFNQIQSHLIEHGIPLLYTDKQDMSPDILYFEDPNRMKVECILSGNRL